MRNLTILLATTLFLAGAANAQKVTLEYWTSYNSSEPQAQVIQQAVNDFQAANPNVKVNINFAGRDLRKLLLPALNSGKTVDLIDGGASNFTGGSYAKNLLSLERYLARPSVGDPGKTVKSVLFPGMLNLTRTNGRLVGIPMTSSVLVYFYNKEAFKKAKITTLPTTWPAFLNAAKALKAAGYEPITVDEDAYTDNNFAYAMLRAAGSCTAVSKTMNDRTGKLWNLPEYLSMAKDIRGLYDAGYFAKDMPASRYPGGQQRVALGEVAMNMNGSWLPNEVKATSGPDYQWGAFAYPKLSAGKGSTEDLMMSPQMMAIIAKSKYPDQAFDLIRYIISKKTQEALVKQAGGAPVRPDVAWPPALSEARQVLAQSSNPVPAACNLRATSGEILTNVAVPAFADLMNGKLTPDAYIKRMSSESAKFWSTRK